MEDDRRRIHPHSSSPLPVPAEQRDPARFDQLRVARPVSDLARARSMYCSGLGWTELGAFVDHQGFDGVMVGIAGAPYHFEFTVCRSHPVAPHPTREDLIVLYVPGREEWARRCKRMRDAGFRQVSSFNPYWEVRGRTFEDPDGYRVVLECAAWRGAPAPR